MILFFIKYDFQVNFRDMSFDHNLTFKWRIRATWETKNEKPNMSRCRAKFCTKIHNKLNISANETSESELFNQYKSMYKIKSTIEKVRMKTNLGQISEITDSILVFQGQSCGLTKKYNNNNTYLNTS